MCFFFFFKQKTAYEMRISDWSSDVCSSDLLGHLNEAAIRLADQPGGRAFERDLARRHRPRPELVLEADDAVAVRLAVGQPPRHEEQAEALGSRLRAFRPRQHQREIGKIGRAHV